MKINRTYIMGIVCLLLAAFVAWQTTLIPDRLVSNEPGPKMFPFISAAGIAVFAVLSMIFDGGKEGASKQYLNASGWKRLVLIMVECLVFCLAMNYIGFWFTSMIGTFVFIWTLKGEKKINILFCVVFCIVLGSICYFGFTRGFNIPLPSGVIWKTLGIKML